MNGNTTAKIADNAYAFPIPLPLPIYQINIPNTAPKKVPVIRQRNPNTVSAVNCAMFKAHLITVQIPLFSYQNAAVDLDHATEAIKTVITPALIAKKISGRRNNFQNPTMTRPMR